MRTEDIFFKNKRIDFYSTKKYFEFYRAIIETFCSELRSRLEKREFLSAKLSKLHPTKINLITEDDIAEIAEFYHSVLSKNGYDYVFSSLKKEINDLKNISLSDSNNFVDILEELVSFPMVKKLYEILVTITVTNSSAERSFSKLKIIKTYLRNKLADKNLNNEALISLNRDFTIDPSEVLEKFANDNNLRIEI